MNKDVKANYYSVVPAEVKYNNKIDRLFNYIVEIENQIPKEFDFYKEKILDVVKRFEMNYSKSVLITMSEENIEKVKIICFCLAMLVKENVGHLLYKINRDRLISLYDECKLREQEYEIYYEFR